jgi:hypothetical protein
MSVTVPPTVSVDGKLDEPAWKADWTAPFVDIEGPLADARFETRAKMLWDEKHFYIGAELEETDIWATLTERDSIIFYDNDFEVFIDPSGSTHLYYELEMNALGTEWDLLLVKPYRDNGPAVHAWDIRGLKTGVFADGTVNQPGDKDRRWCVEVAMPWEVLKECAPDKKPPSAGDQWRVNFSRVEYRVEVKEGKYFKVADPKTPSPSRRQLGLGADRTVDSLSRDVGSGFPASQWGRERLRRHRARRSGKWFVAGLL